MKQKALKYTQDVFNLTPTQLKEVLNQREIDAEYQRMRHLAQARIRRLEQAGYDVKSAQKIKNRLPSLSELKRLYGASYQKAVAKQFSQVGKYLGTKTSTVSGMRSYLDKFADSMNKRGYKFVTRENVYEVTKFMEYWRHTHQDKAYSSKQILQMLMHAKNAGVSNEELQKDFKKYMELRNVMSKSNQKRDGESSKDYLKRLQNVKRERASKRRK